MNLISDDVFIKNDIDTKRGIKQDFSHKIDEKDMY